MADGGKVTQKTSLVHLLYFSYQSAKPLTLSSARYMRMQVSLT